MSELSLVKARERRKEAEELSEIFPGSYLEEIRQRNRLDRLRRACRDQISGDQEVNRLLESGPSSTLLDPIPLNILAEDSDPLPPGIFFRQIMKIVYDRYFCQLELKLLRKFLKIFLSRAAKSS